MKIFIQTRIFYSILVASHSCTFSSMFSKAQSVQVSDTIKA